MSVAYEERSGKRCTKKVKTIIISISETFVFLVFSLAKNGCAHQKHLLCFQSSNVILKVKKVLH